MVIANVPNFLRLPDELPGQPASCSAFETRFFDLKVSKQMGVNSIEFKLVQSIGSERIVWVQFACVSPDIVMWPGQFAGCWR